MFTFQKSVLDLKGKVQEYNSPKKNNNCFLEIFNFQKSGVDLKWKT